MSVVSLADVERMPLAEYEAWHRFLKNHLQRVKVTDRARQSKR